MKIKASATVVVSMHPSALHAMEVVDRVWRKIVGRHARITGLGEEGHSEGSLHYGIPGDIRTRAFDVDADEEALPTHLRDEVDAELRRRLPRGEFDIILEASGTPNVHYHIETDPR